MSDKYRMTTEELIRKTTPTISEEDYENMSNIVDGIITGCDLLNKETPWLTFYAKRNGRTISERTHGRIVSSDEKKINLVDIPKDIGKFDILHCNETGTDYLINTFYKLPNEVYIFECEISNGNQIINGNNSNIIFGDASNSPIVQGCGNRVEQYNNTYEALIKILKEQNVKEDVLQVIRGELQELSEEIKPDKMRIRIFKNIMEAILKKGGEDIYSLVKTAIFKLPLSPELLECLQSINFG